MSFKTNVRNGNKHLFEIPGVVLYRKGDEITIGDVKYVVTHSETKLTSMYNIYDVQVERLN